MDKKEPKTKLGANEVYCQECSNVISKNASICPKCGVKNSANTSDYVRKDKSIAVILAVFVSFWTWLYTYKKDSWKFWLNLALSICTFGLWLIVAWFWALIDTVSKPDEFYEKFPR